MDTPLCFGCFQVAFALDRGCVDCEYARQCGEEGKRLERSRTWLLALSELHYTNKKMNQQPYMQWMRRNRRK